MTGAFACSFLVNNWVSVEENTPDFVEQVRDQVSGVEN